MNVQLVASGQLTVSDPDAGEAAFQAQAAAVVLTSKEWGHLGGNDITAEFVHPDDRERTLKQNLEVRMGGRATSFENRYRCKDGSYRWLLWNASPYPAGRVIYSVARDVTERKRAEREREELVEQLQTALAEVRTLRELLSICSYCKRIRDDGDGDGDRWQSVESYIARHTATRFSHGICPTCFEQHVEPQLNAPPPPQPRR